MSLARCHRETDVANNPVMGAKVNTVCHVFEVNGRVRFLWIGFRVHFD
jgi:hypothetical protein